MVDFKNFVSMYCQTFFNLYSFGSDKFSLPESDPFVAGFSRMQQCLAIQILVFLLMLLHKRIENRR